MAKRKPIEDFQTSLWKLLSSAQEEWVGQSHRALTRYEEEYRKDIEAAQRKSSLAALARTISKAQVTYIGDDHALSQSRESFLFLISRVLKHKKRIGIGLEMVHAEDQKHLDRYLAGEVQENEFLRLVKYWDRWGFDWSSYRKVLQFAKKAKLPVLALNSESKGEDPLHRRDDKAAARISDFLGSHPNIPLFVLFGEHHISDSHLPRRVDERLRRDGAECRSAIVHQFSTAEDLERVNPPRTQVLRMGERTFRLISSSPLAALSSHLEWLEIGSRGEKQNVDHEELRALLLDRIHSVGLALSVLLEQKSEVLDRFEILLESDSRDALRYGKEASLSKEELEVLAWEIERLPVVAIPRTPYLLLNDTSFPAVCEAAGQILARGEDRLPLESDALLFFCARAFRTGLGYFSSKLFDPYRTPKPPHAWIERWSEAERQKLSEWKNLFRQFLRSPQLLPEFDSQLKHLPKSTQNALCRSLGEVFGTKIYRSFTQGNLTAEDLAQLFRAANGPQHGMLSSFLGFLRRTDSITS